ncbi:hypothetical protein CWIS_04905 [Cellulomonas sp. A375-1]|uniref:helix-turn-helix domain-containing protein n=1 Tax=Cellulomonas sp. A375-1 TaxID=1672219 RepID=UPI0006528655|nr:helix-turn-helix domain-containing protein [Cellulomonas sp. A375-1]KMM46521.1 hypothetical protein CWIS_04905 [Cellulomonas sp. A375-1]
MDMLTIEEASASYRIPVRTLHYWVQRGEGPKSFKLGRRRMYKREDIEAWIQEAYETATGGAA